MEQILRDAGLVIVSTEGKYINLAHGYRIEVEREQLYKLMHEGSVIAPFDDEGELVRFIQEDMRLNDLA